MKKYRISKYNPKFRNPEGAYSLEDWTSCFDIGKQFHGITLSIENYLKTEQAYIDVILKILKRNHVNTLTVQKAEKHLSLESFRPYYEASGLPPSDEDKELLTQFHSGMQISSPLYPRLLKLLLREACWGVLSSQNPSCCVEFGYDYYVYVTLECFPHSLIQIQEAKGIFVEEIALET